LQKKYEYQEQNNVNRFQFLFKYQVELKKCINFICSGYKKGCPFETAFFITFKRH
jgi:hypothetical protein